MSAVLDVSDRELRTLEADCATEIALRIVRGEWDDFWSEEAGSIDLHCDVQAALKEMSGSTGKPDADVAMGRISLAVEKHAAIYAADYVAKHADVQELAYKLRVLEDE